MSRGEKLTLGGVCGMILMGLCLESDFWIPALILFAGFGLLAFAGHLLADEGFINSEDLNKISKKKIQQNREAVFRNWIKSGTIK